MAKRCRYAPKVSVLGSREQMCIHREVSALHGAAQGAACRSVCAGGSCEYRANTDDYVAVEGARASEVYTRIPAVSSLSDSLLLILQYIPIIQLDLADMEDLTILGKAKTFCLYYAARARAQVHKALPSLPAAAAVHSF